MREVSKPTAAKPLLTLTAADLMTTPVTTLPQTMTLREAAGLLSGPSISGAPVVDAQGHCVGVLSSSDFVTWAGKGAEEGEQGTEIRFIAPWGEVISIEDSPDHEIHRYMTVPPVTVSPRTPIGDLAQKMVDDHIHRILVVDHDGPRGIVTSTDILAAVVRAAAQESESPRPARAGPSRRSGRGHR